jgi:hypothetical protein
MKDKKRLISLDKVLDRIEEDLWFTESEKSTMRMFLIVEREVDAVEVIHAKWQNEGFGCWSCSSCLEIFTFDDYGDVHPKDDCGCNYCPNCGAKMDGENNEHS